MPDERRFLVDVGMKDFPFPIRVASKLHPEGQGTIANISISARIMKEFQARWIDRFIQIIHAHRERLSTKTLGVNILGYLRKLGATMVKIDFEFPYFMEKLIPVSKEKSLVRYLCNYSAKVTSLEAWPKIHFKIDVPAITTYPMSSPEKPGGLFGQLSVVSIEVENKDKEDVYPEDLVKIVDEHALAPVYSFLTEEDQKFLIEKIHSEKKSSVVMTDEIKDKLARNRDIRWYSVQCKNFGMLHSYSTFIGTEKSAWVPFSGCEEEEI